jgi:hypothetical protein
MCRSKAEGGRRCKGKASRSSASATTVGGSASQGFPSQIRRTRAVVLRDAEEQLGELLDSLVEAAPVDSVAILTSAIDADAAQQIADAITASLEANGWPRSKWESHLLCSVLAAIAQAMEASEDLAKTVVNQALTMALKSSGAPEPVASLAARAAVDALMKLSPVRHWEDMRRGVQLLAVSLCPKVGDHPEVEQYCLRPLASELLSDVLQQELAELSGNSSVATS